MGVSIELQIFTHALCLLILNIALLIFAYDGFRRMRHILSVRNGSVYAWKMGLRI